MKTRSLILFALTILFLLSIPIVLSNIVEILLEFGTGITIQLGSGVNITEGTIIRLNGLNCNLTVVGNHIVDSMEVNPTYVLFNTSLADLTYTLNVPYNYLSSIKVLNITCSQPNTETTLTVNISNLNGIKIYKISEPANLTSVDWSPSSQNFTLTVNAPTGVRSTVKIHWSDSVGPGPYPPQCIGGSSCTSNFDVGTHMVTLNATHSSPVTWILHAQSVSTTTTTIPSDTEKPKWSNFYRYPPEPTIITTLDSVTINVTWYDNQNLGKVIIWENSTGVWQGHVA